ncbi:MAG: hypothetical protein SFU53_13135 [Terrimicrobiaceae bacterium]|nr:hypothetical protein [Terrimicrobiaceae bacterium]
MKIPLCFLIIAACSATVSAQVVIGDELEIGPAGSNQVTNTWTTSYPAQMIPAKNSGAIGSGNQVRQSYSFAIGISNTIEETTSMALGTWNIVGDDFPWGGRASLAVGTHNQIHSDDSLAVGYANYLAGSGYEFAGGEMSMLVGVYNQSGGVASLAVGRNNLIQGDDYDATKVEASAVIGRGLITKWNHALVVGQYNDSDIPQNSGLLFAVGNGAMSGPRSNAMEVYLDGRIKMPRQGDILMGEFGNPGD